MDSKETIPQITASEAKALAKETQAKNFEYAFAQIKMSAEQGFEEHLLFGIWLSRENVFKLMEMGYSVTTVYHPFEQRNMYKVSW